MAVLFGLMMAQDRPSFMAMAKNMEFMISRCGSPKEMLDTPSMECAWSSSLIPRTVSSVVRAELLSVEMVMARPSMTISSFSIPQAAASSMMRRAMASLPSALSGMPFSSSGRATRTPPYLAASGRIRSRLSRFPLTELIMGLPLQTRSPLSSTSGLEVSICRGSGQIPWSCRTTSSMRAGSSTSGSPTLTSSMSAPASSCSMPWRRM